MAKGCTRRHRDCGTRPCDCQELRCLMERSPRDLGIPFLRLGYRGFTIAERETSDKKSGCLKDTKVLKASDSPLWPTDCHQGTWRITSGLEDLCISLLHAKMKKIHLLKQKSMAKKLPNHSGTLRGPKCFWKHLYRLQVLHFIKATLLGRRQTQEMKHRILCDTFLPSILISYTKYYGENYLCQQ